MCGLGQVTLLEARNLPVWGFPLAKQPLLPPGGVHSDAHPARN